MQEDPLKKSGREKEDRQQSDIGMVADIQKIGMAPVVYIGSPQKPCPEHILQDMSRAGICQPSHIECIARKKRMEQWEKEAKQPICRKHLHGHMPAPSFVVIFEISDSSSIHNFDRSTQHCKHKGVENQVSQGTPSAYRTILKEHLYATINC